jgi:hypothetical protein
MAAFGEGFDEKFVANAVAVRGVAGKVVGLDAVPANSKADDLLSAAAVSVGAKLKGFHASSQHIRNQAQTCVILSSRRVASTDSMVSRANLSGLMAWSSPRQLATAAASSSSR